jgi:hypothetical protein
VVKITPDGKLTPWASGFRSPNGLGYDTKGRLFVTDNQGDWLGACPLYHVEKGKFYGHPAALTWKQGENRDPVSIPSKELDAMRTRGSVVFPYLASMAMSPTQPLTDTTGGKFGPFSGQMLVGEMNHARILRMAMEEVDGQLQGMVVPLLEGHGLHKGDNRLAFAPDGSLWVGQTEHGWAGDKGIQRITWTEKVPLDVKEMHLTKTGFELTFTQPVESSAAGNPESYKVRRYYYDYHAAYGSPEFDLQQITPKSATLSEDRTKVTLEFDTMVAWRIYEFHLTALKNDEGVAIANPLVAYTLNHLVGSKTPPPPEPGLKQDGTGAEPARTEEPKPEEKKEEPEQEEPKKTTPAPKPTPAKTTPKPADSGRKATPVPATPTPKPKPGAKPAVKVTPTPTPKKK